MAKVIGVIIIIVGLCYAAYVFVFQAETTNPTSYGEAVINSPERANEFRLQQNLKLIRDAIQVFSGNHGRYPSSLQELADKGIIDTIPPDPFGGSYFYDPDKGQVKSTSKPKL